MKVKSLKRREKICLACGYKFEPWNSLQTCCSPICAIEYDKLKKAEKAAKEHTQKKREFRLSDKSLQKKLAQACFNKYVRLRDEGLPCIACSRHHKGQIHASHYRSTGSQPQLRFHEDNCHAGCQPCNTHLSGNLISYRINLMQKIGQERVDFLEQEHPPRKYTADELIEIASEYKRKHKELKNSREFESYQ